jgi:DNA polymerase elongation subunit (family B)/predicted RNA-binding Zn-ribbon protein involved in translation (DUF1610 family)
MSNYTGIKILEIDIETSPNLGWFWDSQLYHGGMTIEQIEEPTRMLCFAARWQHKNITIFRSEYHDGREEMLEELWYLLDEADVVIHYYGSRFDVPHINREFIKHGYLPPSPYDQIDLKNVAKKHFRFPSNKLNWVGQYLGVGEKVLHEGFLLWKKCLEGDPKAWSTMKKYNIQDTKLLRDVYYFLLPWITNHPNRGLWMKPGTDPICPNCGSTDLRFKGYKRTRVLQYKQYNCRSCGAYPRERYASDPKKREDILR